MNRILAATIFLALAACGGASPPPLGPPAPIPAPAPTPPPVYIPPAYLLPPTGLNGDGVGDNAPAIQAALDKGGVIYLPPGVYRLSAPLKVNSNTELRLDGTLRLDGGIDPGYSPPAPPMFPYGLSNQVGVIWIQKNATNVKIDGSGVIDGNRSLQTHCCIGGIITGGPNIGDYAAGTSNITISGLSVTSPLTIQNVAQWPISIDGTNGASLSNLVITNAGNSVQFAHGSKNVGASGLRISNIDDVGFSFYNMVSFGNISNSTVTGAKGSGIGVLTDGVIPADLATTGLSDNITIDHNTSTGNNGGFDANNVRDRTVQYFSSIQFSNNISSGSVLYGYGVMGCNLCRLLNNRSTNDHPALFEAYNVTNLTASGNNF